MTGLSTHVLDLVIGKPAQGVAICVHFDGAEVARAVTDSDGRAADLLDGRVLGAGVYRIVFSTGEYFRHAANGAALEPFFDEIPIEFTIRSPAARYHVPLLVSPFGYSTYRGS